jgi:cyanophycin synthetase
MLDKLFKKLDELKVPYFQIDSDYVQVGYGAHSTVLHSTEHLQEKRLQELSRLIDEGYLGTIPIFSITGSNGKTTTSRLIHHILKKLGYTVGLAYTGGIIIGEEKLREGDTTGFYSAREVLSDKRVEAAVLETARGGIISNGLGYKEALVGIITTISEDHLGLDGVENLEDLARVKAVVIKSVSSNGKAVIKAQKELVEAARDIPVSKLCMFSLDKNGYLREHIERGGEAFYVRDNFIVHNICSEEIVLLNIDELEFAYRGASRSNILNIMAAVAAVGTLYKDYTRILDSVKALKCDLRFNSGRQNIIELGKFKVLLDYGHNPEAYEEVFSLVWKLRPKRVTTSIICPGDRTDEHIRKLGYIAGCNSDFLILREPDRPRGREKAEILNLFREGAAASGLSKASICEACDEVEAVELAISRAVEGEIIVLFVENVDRILPILENCK